MKRLIGITLLCLFTVSLAGPALAWEYKMKGETVWRYRYLSRTGNNDIFGRVGGATNLGVNHVKNWPTPSTNNQHDNSIGILAGEPGFGADADMTDYRATLYPKIKINKAISLSASVNMTSLGIHSAGRPYDNYGSGPGFINSMWVPISNRMAAANTPNMFVTVQWWKISVKLPWFGLSTGTKTSGFGIGIVKNKYHDRPSTSFSMTAAYGPIYIGFSPYFGRTNSNWNDWPRDSVDDNNPWRKDDDRDYFRGWIFGISYVNGDLIIGFQNDGYAIDAYNTGTYVSRTGANLNTPGAWPAASGTATPPLQHANFWTSDSGIYIKYFNGRFFFNAEVDYFWEYRSGRGTIEYRAGLPLIHEDRDESAWAYAVETGFVTGPLKVTANYFRSTGDDPATRKIDENAGSAYAGISASYVYDWAYLMYYTYGAGAYFDGEGKGQPANLHHLGIRLDYGVACNLNVYGVYSYAWRDQPNAYRLGGNYLNTQARFSNNDIAAAHGLSGFAVNPAGINRAVPDHARYIGWEVDLGVDWKLLENLTWRTKFAYWQPGNWWAFAYPNTSRLYDLTPAGASPSPAFNTFFNATRDLGRDIDALIALETTITLDF